ncbi:hypothetical protein PAMP_002195 [Pampus punctatissimus]
MFSAVVLVVSCLLQRNLVTTEGHHGTNSYVFYAVEMDGGIKAARALAEQHGLEFIQRVGSLEGLFTLRDSRGRPDRATFEDRLAAAAGVLWVQRQHSHYRDKRAPVTGLDHTATHRLFMRDGVMQANLQKTSKFAQGEYNSSGFDLNVMPVWSNNITGNGVVITIIDDELYFRYKVCKNQSDVNPGVVATAMVKPTEHQH